MMTPEMISKLRQSLILHEGYRKYPYTDSTGKMTVGIGYNITDRGMDDGWINTQYQKDVAYFYNQLAEFPWFFNLNVDRQIVLIDMSFMGWKNFLEFKGMLEALANEDFKLASEEMLNSKWAEETKSRATTLAHAMLTGIYNL